MAWTTPVRQNSRLVVDATKWNTEVVDDMAISEAATVTTAGQIPIATGANALTVIAKNTGAIANTLVSDSGEAGGAKMDAHNRLMVVNFPCTGVLDSWNDWAHAPYWNPNNLTHGDRSHSAPGVDWFCQWYEIQPRGGEFWGWKAQWSPYVRYAWFTINLCHVGIAGAVSQPNGWVRLVAKKLPYNQSYTKEHQETLSDSVDMENSDEQEGYLEVVKLATNNSLPTNSHFWFYHSGNIAKVLRETLGGDDLDRWELRVQVRYSGPYEMYVAEPSWQQEPPRVVSPRLIVEFSHTKVT